MFVLTEVNRFFDNIHAVKNLTLTIPAGQVLGLLGPNGAGKTTTIRLISGTLAPSSGTILINDIDITKNPIKAKEMIGYLPEHAPIWHEMSVYEYLEFCGSMKGLCGKELKDDILNSLNLCDLVDVKNSIAENLSKGYKRRICMAQALLGNPPILILDEPTDGLDPNQKKDMRKLIKKLSETKTIIICTHLLEEIDAVCNSIAIIAEGNLVFTGTPKEMREKSIFANTISLSFAHENSEEHAIILKKIKDIDSVQHVHCEGDLFRIYLKGKKVKEEFFKQLLDLGLPPINEIITDKGHLDDVFYSLTKDL